MATTDFQVTASMDGLADTPMLGSFSPDGPVKPGGVTYTKARSKVGGIEVDRIVCPLEGGGQRLLICRAPFESILLEGGVANPLYHTDVPADADKAMLDDAWTFLTQTLLNPPPFQWGGTNNA